MAAIQRREPEKTMKPSTRIYRPDIKAQMASLAALPPESVERCPDCDGDGVTGTSTDSPPCGTCEPEARAAWAASYTWPDHIPRKFSSDDCTREQADEFVRESTAILERRKSQCVLDTDDEGEAEDRPVASGIVPGGILTPYEDHRWKGWKGWAPPMKKSSSIEGETMGECDRKLRKHVDFMGRPAEKRRRESEDGPAATFGAERPKRLRTLEDTDDGIDEAGWESKVQELPVWDRCEGDGGSAGVDALDLSDPAGAPFGRKWRIGLVVDEPRCPRCLESFDEFDIVHVVGEVQIREECLTEPRGATDHHGLAAPAPAPTAEVEITRGQPCPQCGCVGRHFCTGKPSKGATGWSGKVSEKLSETCAELATMGFMDPREVVGHAAVEEHVYRWHGDEIERGSMTFRTKTKADQRVGANVEAWGTGR